MSLMPAMQIFFLGFVDKFPCVSMALGNSTLSLEFRLTSPELNFNTYLTSSSLIQSLLFTSCSDLPGFYHVPNSLSPWPATPILIRVRNAYQNFCQRKREAKKLSLASLEFWFNFSNKTCALRIWMYYFNTFHKQCAF